ncbi:ankyrin repeat-containing domain protein [Lasiosphaeria ovina]|uniref:Ankyrin repeat-containing domain protein n=1 Tax=Lasiosphaeria ovina TaxID=92902 RepID=A0AAE0NJT5_9PEZI|nr:ankyrin repeat-containing domain protein [Lasiosphaeria ovina]
MAETVTDTLAETPIVTKTESAAEKEAVGFGHVPAELVMRIARYVAADGGSDVFANLSALSRTCRAFWVWVGEILYRLDATSQTPLALFWGAFHGLDGTVSRALAAKSPVNTSIFLLNAATPPKRNETQYDVGVSIESPSNLCVAAPLHLAARLGRTNMVTALLDAGANISAQARLVAICTKHSGIARLLLEHAGPILYSQVQRRLEPLREGGLTSTLHTADHVGSLEMVRLLITAGISVNYLDFRGHTALHHAVSSLADTAPKVIQMLVDAGAAVDLFQPKFAFEGGVAASLCIWPGTPRTPLQEALCFRNFRAVHALLDAEADPVLHVEQPNIAAFVGNALHMSVLPFLDVCPRTDELKSVLIARPPNEYERHPLDLQRALIVKIVLGHGVAVDTPIFMAKTPTTRTKIKRGGLTGYDIVKRFGGDESVADLLVSLGANPYEDEWTPEGDPRLHSHLITAPASIGSLTDCSLSLGH